MHIESAKLKGEAVKNYLFLAPLAVTLSGMIAAGQTGTPTITTVSFSAQQSYSPDAIKVVGTLNSGQTSQLVEYSRPGQYRAFVFEGNGHDAVDVTVTGANGKAYIALADSTLMPIASGIGHLTATLPYHGPDIEAFYILVKPTSSGPSRFTVHFKKAPATAQTQPAQAQSADATR
jgi:hypothetical protein